MNKILVFVSLVMGSIVLSSCEGGTTFTKIVENNSSETITIKLFQNTFLEDKIFVIEPNQKETIFLIDHQGLFVGDGYECISEIDSVEVSITNDKILLKDLMTNSSWTQESKGGRNSMEICTVTITDEDLN